MTSQDRTSEFFSLCQSLPPPPLNQTSSNNNPNNPNNTNNTTKTSGRYSTTSTTTTTPSDPNDELRSFHQTASTISRDIYSTSTLLNELTTLIHSRSSSLFVDESSTVNSLVIQIKTNIEILNSKLDNANEMIQRNKRRLGGKHSQKSMEVTNLVGQLQEEFVNTTKGFKDVLQVRSDRMKEKTDRRHDLLGGGGGRGDNDTDANGMKEEEVSLLGNKPKVYGDTTMNGMNGNDVDMMKLGGLTPNGQNGFGNMAGGPRLDLTSAIMNQHKDASSNMPVGESSMQLPRPYGIEASSTGLTNRFAKNNNDNLPSFSGSISSLQQQQQQHNTSSLPVYTPLDIQQMEEQSGQSQMMQLIPDQTYLRERADAMEAVESNIAELGTIFNKLAVMVNEHSEMVTRVEDNVDAASDNLTLSMETLTDTLDNLRSNRALFFKLMTVLVVFIFFFIVFFA